MNTTPTNINAASPDAVRDQLMAVALREEREKRGLPADEPVTREALLEQARALVAELESAGSDTYHVPLARLACETYAYAAAVRRADKAVEALANVSAPVAQD